MEKQALAGYLAGTGLAGAAGFVYVMEKAAGANSALTDMLDEIVSEAHVNEKKAELTAQLLMSELPQAMDIDRSELLKAAAYVEAVHANEPQENRVAILEDMVKRANDMTKEAFPMGTLGTGLGMAAGMGAGMYAAGHLAGTVKNAAQYKKFTAVFDYVVKHNQVLKHQYEQNPKKLRSFAETIFDFSPNVAMDPNLLSTVLANAAMGDSMDPTTIDALAKLQSNYTKVHEEGMPFSGTSRVAIPSNYGHSR